MCISVVKILNGKGTRVAEFRGCGMRNTWKKLERSKTVSREIGYNGQVSMGPGWTKLTSACFPSKSAIENPPGC